MPDPLIALVLLVLLIGLLALGVWVAVALTVVALVAIVFFSTPSSVARAHLLGYRDAAPHSPFLLMA